MAKIVFFFMKYLDGKFVFSKAAYQSSLFSSKFMQEYEELGHMNQVNKDASSTEERYYLPHHAAFKSSSSTTLTAVAFDGICCSSKGQPLKDTLLVGPTIKKK